MPVGIYKRTKEHGNKISASRKGHVVTTETRLKIGRANKGRKPTEEARRKMSAAAMNHIPWNKGKAGVCSEETLKLMSESHKIHGWSRKNDCCVKCGTTEKPHQAHGLCSYCHKRKRLIENREEELKYLRDYHKKNRDRERIQRRPTAKRYRQTAYGKQMKKLSDHKRRARKKNANFWKPWMGERWYWMLDATEGYCPKCGEPFDSGDHKLTMDHIIPLTPKPGNPQGHHHIDNIQVLCLSCNCSKGNMQTIY